MGDRVAEVGQQSVAAVLGQMAVVTGDDAAGDGLVVGEDVAQRLGVELLGQGGRADEVAEEDGDLAVFGSGRGGGRVGRRRDPEGGAARAAEAGAGRDFGRARRAAGGERGAAHHAEAGGGGVVVVAVGAVHGGWPGWGVM